MGKIIFFLRTTRALSNGGEIILYFWLGLGCKDDRNALTLKHFQKCFGNVRYFWLGLGCKDDRNALTFKIFQKCYGNVRYFWLGLSCKDDRISLLKKACSFESFKDYAR